MALMSDAVIILTVTTKLKAAKPDKEPVKLGRKPARKSAKKSSKASKKKSSQTAGTSDLEKTDEVIVIIHSKILCCNTVSPCVYNNFVSLQFGRTLLMEAVRSGNNIDVLLLLASGAVVDARDNVRIIIIHDTSYKSMILFMDTFQG